METTITEMEPTIKEIIQHFKETGDIDCNNSNVDYKDIIFIASRDESVYLVKSLLEKTECYNDDDYLLDDALIEAAEFGNKDVVDFLIEKGAKCLDSAMEAAAIFGNLSLVDHIREKNFDFTDWNGCLYGAAKGNHRVLVDEFIKRNNDSGFEIDWDIGMNGAFNSGNIDLIKFFLGKLIEHNVSYDIQFRINHSKRLISKNRKEVLNYLENIIRDINYYQYRKLLNLY